MMKYIWGKVNTSYKSVTNDWVGFGWLVGPPFCTKWSTCLSTFQLIRSGGRKSLTLYCAISPPLQTTTTHPFLYFWLVGYISEMKWYGVVALGFFTLWESLLPVTYSKAQIVFCLYLLHISIC